MIKICPRCNQRYIIGAGVTDFVHDCNSGNLAIDQEDVVVSGDWEDYSGSGTISPQEVLRQGLVNELQGSDEQIEGRKDKEKLTRRGKRASTRRQRQHEEFINLKCEGLY